MLLDVNNQSQVIGWQSLCAPREFRDFFWDAQTSEYRMFDCFEGHCGTFVAELNNRGHVAGYTTEPWIWRPGEGFIGFGFPSDLDPNRFPVIYDLNDRDEVIGSYPYNTSGGLRAFRWSPELEWTILWDGVAWDINEHSWVVGISQIVGGCNAKLWTPQHGLIDLCTWLDDGNPLPLGDASGINDLNQIVGSGVWIPGIPEAYMLDQQTGLHRIGHISLEGDEVGSGARAINNRSEVIGIDYGGPSGAKPFVWTARRGIRDLRALLDPCATGVALAGSPGGINDRGQIIVDAYTTAFERGLLLSPYIPGDLDDDGDCDLQDLAYQLSNFGRAGDADYSAGDLDCDQDVDLQDLSTLLANFGETLP